MVVSRSESRECVGHGRRGGGELSSKRGSVRGITAITMCHPNDGAIVRWMQVGLSVNSRVDTITTLKRKRSRESLIISIARGSDVAESLAKVVDVDVSVVTRTADTAVEVAVGIGSDCSFLDIAFGEGRSSNIAVWIEVRSDVVA